jgi:hypothetical protein
MRFRDTNICSFLQAANSDKSKAVIALSKDAQNHSEFLRIETIDGVTIEEIQRVAKKHIKPGRKIVSDVHSSYKQLMEVGFVHEAKAYYKEDKDDFLKMLHIIIGNVKAYIHGTCHGLGSTYFHFNTYWIIFKNFINLTRESY